MTDNLVFLIGGAQHGQEVEDEGRLRLFMVTPTPIKLGPWLGQKKKTDPDYRVPQPVEQVYLRTVVQVPVASDRPLEAFNEDMSLPVYQLEELVFYRWDKMSGSVTDAVNAVKELQAERVRKVLERLSGHRIYPQFEQSSPFNNKSLAAMLAGIQNKQGQFRHSIQVQKSGKTYETLNTPNGQILVIKDP